MHCTWYLYILEGYSDTNWISDIIDPRSTSRYMFTLGGAVIFWKFLKQTVIAKTAMEYEFITLDKCEEEAEWLHISHGIFEGDQSLYPQMHTLL